jgi:hypothetical protein
MPTPDHDYSPPFKFVSVVSGLFITPIAFVATAGRMGDPTHDISVFCVLSYLFLQFSSASHQRQGLRTVRAQVYFWLLASFPLWSIPIGSALYEFLCRIIGSILW